MPWRSFSNWLIKILGKMHDQSFRNHTLLDFLGGNFAIAFPFLLGIDRSLGETWIPVVCGFALLLNNFFTDHDLGIFRHLNGRQHFALDVAIGIVIAISPWLAGFWHYVFMPHLVFGLAWAVYSFRNLQSVTTRSSA